MARRDWRRLAAEGLRFCLVGGLMVLLNNLIVVTLTEILHFYYLLSIVLCTLGMTLVSFLLNRQWTFRKSGAMAGSELIRYMLCVLANLGVVILLTWMLVRLGLPYYWSNLIVAAVMAPTNFLVHRIWSFAMDPAIVPQPRS
ncbi:GtrA family protein [Sphingobium sp. WCS2017Hpa-17]|uniref:GtrA family protein n=1 Tax=Sphingobium sp. WCS2017Hpa-17 TaxID=3073638 RepID=UPI00288968E8|nr:GtrA family protein [Sphingobium sp. WCS2017Hpa-17]